MEPDVLFARPLTGKNYDLINPLFGFTRSPDRYDPFHCKPDPHPLRHDNDAWTVLERDEGREVSGHGAMIMREQNASLSCCFGQYLVIRDASQASTLTSCRRQLQIDSRFTPQRRVHNPTVEVCIRLKANFHD
jgi:hypothetical protein